MRTRDEQEPLTGLVSADRPGRVQTNFGDQDVQVQAQDRLRLALDSIPALLHSAEPDGSLDYFNQRWLDYLGVSLSDIKGWEWISKVHPDDVDALVKEWRSSLRTGEPLEVEARVRRADGVYRWMLHRKVPLRDEQGNVIKWYGSSIDIDELKRSEFYLAEGQRLGHAGSWSFKPDGTCDYWSRELYEILGFDPRNGVPTISDYFTRVHIEDRAIVEATIRRMIVAGEGCDLKKRIIRPNGARRMIRCVGMPVWEQGVVTRFVGTLMDITEQEELTQELRASEQKYRHLVDTTPAFVHTALPNGEVDFYNRGWLEYVGLSLTDLLGWGWTRMLHPEDVETIVPKWRVALEAGEAFVGESRVRRADGQYRWFLHREEPLRNEAGTIVKWYGSSIEIEERKIAEEAIRRNQAYLAEAQKLSKTGSFAWSPATDNTYYSEECYRVLGFEPQGASPPPLETVMQRIHPEDQAHCRELVEKAIRDKADFELDYRIVHPDKKVRDIHCVSHVVLDRSGELVEIVGTVIDITERKRAEEAIRRSEAFLAEGQRLSHTGSWGWNASTGKITWSQEHFRILGLDPQHSNPSLDVFWERVHPDDKIGLRQSFESAIRDKGDFEQEFRIIRPDSSVRHLHGVGHAILNNANELVEFIGSTMDITERKRGEAALQEARAELEAVSRVTTMGELAASIAHEINQPLAGVVTSANAGLNWLAANPPNLSKAREALERVLRDGTRGGEVLARIRALLKRTPPAKTLVGMNQTVRDVLALTTGELRQHSIELSLELASPIPAIRGDNIQLQQVLLNLIKNAIEAMAETAHGQRTLRIQSRLGELDNKAAAVVEVSDTGVGFSGADSSRLFEAFHTTKPQGMGMGLWISRSIIENHHGRLTALPNDGPGATFLIMLPKASEEEA